MLGSIIDAEAHLAGLIKQYPLGRIGQSKDISDAVMWLCSELSLVHHRSIAVH